MGLSTDSPLPVTWSGDGTGVRWKTAVEGEGNSTPIVTGGRVFLTSAHREKGGAVRRVQGFDLETGEFLWQTDVLKGPGERTHALNTIVGATPVSDGESLFVYLGSTLAALDLDGNVLWNREIDPEYQEYSRYGAASSPVLTGDAVIVLQDREYAGTPEMGWLAAFSKKDGSPLWRVEWDDTCCTYSTPVVIDRGAGEEILVALTRVVRSFDPATGEVLWEHGYVINQLVSSPVLEGDLLIVAGGAHNVRSVNAIRLSGAGSATTTETLWSKKGLVPETASPVLYNGLLFSITNKGVLACRDSETGEELWKKRLDQRGNHPSIVAGDGKIYVPSSYGSISVVAAAPEFELLAENRLEPGFGRANASPAIADGTLVIRGEGHLYRIGL